MGYKISYLGLYGINFVAVGVLLILSILGVEAENVMRWCENITCCMGIWMLLSLWGKAFQADENYKGAIILRAHAVKCMTLALFIAECMAIYGVAFEKPNFLLPSIVVLGIWLAAFCYLALISKRLFLPLTEKA